MSRMVGKDTITGMGFIGLEHGRLYKMRRGPNVITATITGRRIVLEKCAGGKLRGLILYGKSTQVTTTGTQLIDINSFRKDDNYSVKIVNNYSIELSSTIEKDASDSSKVYSNALIDADILVGKTITMSYDEWNSNVPNETAVCGIVYNINGKNYYEHLQNSRIKTVTIPLGAKDCKVRLFLIENASATVKAGTYTAIIKGLMICEGTVAKSWEPYTGGKPSPSPDYPQEIQSAGDDGNVAISVTGKNLLDISKANVLNLETSLGCNIMPKSGCIKIFGNATRESYISFSPDTIPIGKKVFLLLKTEGSSHLRLRIAYQKESEKKVSYVYSGDEFLRENTSYKVLAIQLITMPGELNDEVYPMITTEKDTTFEPYKGEQLLTLSTPNGLPGIPVSSDGNYTDSNGQQWICDELDFERGVYRQRIKHVNVVLKKGASSSTHSGYRHMAGDIQNMSREHTECLCNIATHSQNAANGTEGVRASGAYNALVLYYENLTNDNVPADVAYILSDQIETPLSETDIAAYRALTIYEPTTVVETNSGGLKVSYKIVKN